MATGDLKNNLSILMALLKQKKIPAQFQDEEGFRSGHKEAYIKLFRYLLDDYSSAFKHVLVEKGLSLRRNYKDDRRFLDQCYRVFLLVLSYKPKLQVSQFLSTGFVERKVLMATDVIKAVAEYCESVAPKQKPQAPPPGYYFGYSGLKMVAEIERHIAVSTLSTQSQNVGNAPLSVPSTANAGKQDVRHVHHVTGGDQQQEPGCSGHAKEKSSSGASIQRKALYALKDGSQLQPRECTKTYEKENVIHTRGSFPRHETPTGAHSFEAQPSSSMKEHSSKYSVQSVRPTSSRGVMHTAESKSPALQAHVHFESEVQGTAAAAEISKIQVSPPEPHSSQRQGAKQRDLSGRSRKNLNSIWHLLNDKRRYLASCTFPS